MKKSVLALLVTVAAAGCSSTGAVIEKSNPPHVWSDHKHLDIPIDMCALKAYSALRSLGFTAVVQNGVNSYGNFNDNRAAVKCVESLGGSFVYFAVAGPEKSVVERLRNEIAWKF